MKKEFNIIIAGVGGQGLITLLRILAEVAFLQGFDVRTSELHGLSQRGGSVSAHLRFGPSASFRTSPSASLRTSPSTPLRTSKQVFSPLVLKGRADLILGLEMNEALRSVNFSNKGTIFLIDNKFIPYFGGLKEQEVIKKIKRIPAKVHFIEASKFCQERIGNEILAGVYLLGFAATKGLIPLEPNVVLRVFKKVLPKAFFAINKKAFCLGRKYES